MKNIFVPAHFSAAHSLSEIEVAKFTQNVSKFVDQPLPAPLDIETDTYFSCEIDKSTVNRFLTNELEWCTVSSLPSSVCADQLVNSLENHFGGSWGCLVASPDYGAWQGCYFVNDDDYLANCHLYSTIDVKKP